MKWRVFVLSGAAHSEGDYQTQVDNHSSEDSSFEIRLLNLNNLQEEALDTSPAIPLSQFIVDTVSRYYGGRVGVCLLFDNSAYRGKAAEALFEGLLNHPYFRSGGYFKRIGGFDGFNHFAKAAVGITRLVADAPSRE